MNFKDALSKIEQACNELEERNQSLRLRVNLLGRVVISTCSLAPDVPAETEGVVVRFDESHFTGNGKWMPGVCVRFDSAPHDRHWFTPDILELEPSKKTGVPKIMDPYRYRQDKGKIAKIYAHFDAERGKLQAWQGPQVAEAS